MADREETTDPSEAEPDVQEFVEYCHTQAGLLSGRLETLGADVDDLLLDLAEATTVVGERLERDRERLDAAAEPASVREEIVEQNLRETEALQADIEEMQTRLEATQSRMQEIETLVEGYGDLAAELDACEYDGREALDAVVRFEARNDAPSFFDDTQTLFEAVTSSTTDENV